MNKKLYVLLPLLALALGACGQPWELTPELQTPQYPAAPLSEIDFEAAAPPKIHTSDEGIVRIEAKEDIFKQPHTAAQAESDTISSPKEPLSPETVWEEDQVVTYNSYTLPEKLQIPEDGRLGTLSIPALSLEMPIYEAENEMEAMLRGGAHYKDTSAWDGNVGVSAHNSGVPEYASFGNLHRLQKGDVLLYKTSLGERRYQVETVLEIPDDNWSYLGRTADNRITLTTCVTGKPDKRLLVQGVERRSGV